MKQKLIGRIFPFIPIGLGLLLVFFQVIWGNLDAYPPLKIMFFLIISCLISWLFSIAGLIIYREKLFQYYRILFKVFTIIYLLPAIILALFIPWTLLLTLVIFLVGLLVLNKYKPSS